MSDLLLAFEGPIHTGPLIVCFVYGEDGDRGDLLKGCGQVGKLEHVLCWESGRASLHGEFGAIMQDSVMTEQGVIVIGAAMWRAQEQDPREAVHDKLESFIMDVLMR